MLNQLIKKILFEATSDSSGGRGSYVSPLQPGVREFSKESLQPFTTPVSKYIDAELEYDSYDGKMDERRKDIKKIEQQAKKVTDYIKHHPYSTFSDDDGNIVNQYPNGKKKKGIVPIKENYEGKIIRLTENQLLKIIKEIIKEIK